MLESVKCAVDEIVEIHKLQPNPLNPNAHPARQIELLAKIIDYQGQRAPIVVSSRSGFIVKGHGRLEALKKLGWKSAGVDFQEYDSEAQEYADMVADNKIAELAEHDDMKMIDGIKTLGITDFELLGLDGFELPNEAVEPGCDEDEVPEFVEPKTKLGDLYVLGSHRLLCGDSTSVDAVDKLLAGENADMVFTSPPYNAGKNIRGNFYKNDADNKSDDEYVDFISAVTSNCIAHSDFVFVNIQILESNKRAIINYQYRFIDQIKDILIWNKTQYPPHINKGTFGCKWEYVFALASDGKSRAFPCSWQGKFSNVIETENNSGNEFAKDHKAGFPVSFPQWMIERMDFSRSVMDPFGGTGSTLIACEKTNRKCFMMELDPHYCDVIVARWEKYSGKKAVLVGPTNKEG